MSHRPGPSTGQLRASHGIDGLDRSLTAYYAITEAEEPCLSVAGRQLMKVSSMLRHLEQDPCTQ